MGQTLCRRKSAKRKCYNKIAEFEVKVETMFSVLVQEKVAENAKFEQKLSAMSEKIDLLALEEMKEKTEFLDKLAAMSDKVDLFLEKMEEKIAAKSAEPTDIASIAPGSCDCSMLSVSSEQRSLQPQLEMAPRQEGAEEQPSSLPLEDRGDSTLSVNSHSLLPVSFDIIFEPPKTTKPRRLHLQSRANLNEEGQDIGNEGQDWVQKERTAAPDSSTGSQPQDEMRLLPCPLPASAVKAVSHTVKTRACQSETGAEKKKKKTIMNRTWTKRTLKEQEKLDDLPEVPSLDANLQYSLEDSFVYLNSDEGKMKIKGMELIIQLARHQPGELIPKRQEVCQAIIATVKYQRWSVSRVAMWTLGELFIHLKTDMDPELDWVAEVLLEKSTSINKFVCQAATFALECMIKNCSPLSCMEALLNEPSDQSKQNLDQREIVQGGSDEKVAVRESSAAHLLALVETEGAQTFLDLELEMLEHFLLTVSRLTEDGSETVRSCAEKIMAMLLAEQEVSAEITPEESLELAQFQ